MPDHTPGQASDQDNPFLDPEVTSLQQELIEESAEEALNLGSYSDEEIAALVFEGEDRPVPLPWLDSLEPQERELAVAMGMRSLTVRGLVEALPLDDVDSTDIDLAGRLAEYLEEAATGKPSAAKLPVRASVAGG